MVMTATPKGAHFAADKDFDNVRNPVTSLVEDGDLSDQDIADITAAVDDLASSGELTNAQRKEILDLAREGVMKNGKNKVPLPLKILAVLSLVTAGLLLFVGFLAGAALVTLILNGETEQSTTELVLSMLQVVLLVASCALQVVLAIRLLRNNRYGAGRISTALVSISMAMIFNSIMLNGVAESAIYLGIIMALQVMLGAYLSPSLSRERKLSDAVRDVNNKYRALNGTLGLDLEGKGYIKLDLFNLFWVFVVGCVAGLLIEIAFHMIVVEPGVYQDRAGLMWGPFSPIYGFGCVLMTIALNRFKNAHILVIFAVCTVIGGAFEYCVSLWMEIAFGAVAWDYSDQFLNIQGRTCLLYASMFGFLGLIWIKALLPAVLKLINLIPWKARYTVTTVCAILMLFDCIVTVQALDCWYERCAGKPVVSDVQMFYAEHFPNDVMQNRFQSMTIDPTGGHSGTKA